MNSLIIFNSMLHILQTKLTNFCFASKKLIHVKETINPLQLFVEKREFFNQNN